MKIQILIIGILLIFVNSAFGTNDDTLNNKKINPYFNHHIRLSCLADEFGYSLEIFRKPIKSIEYSIGYRATIHHPFMLFPEISTVHFDFCRYNQPKGINLRVEIKKYWLTNRNYYFSYGGEVGYYWTTPQTMSATYSMSSYPQEKYFIENLFSYRAGLNISTGWVNREGSGIKLVLGPRIQLYNLTYHLESSTPNSTLPIGLQVKESGIVFRPTIRLFITYVLHYGKKQLLE